MTGPAIDVVVPTIGRPVARRAARTRLRADGPLPTRCSSSTTGRPPAPRARRAPAALPGRACSAAAAAGPAAARNVGWRARARRGSPSSTTTSCRAPGWRAALARRPRRPAGAGVGGGAGPASACRCRRDRRPTDWERNVAGLRATPAGRPPTWPTGGRAGRGRRLRRALPARLPRGRRPRAAAVGRRVADRAAARARSSHPVGAGGPLGERAQAGRQRRRRPDARAARAATGASARARRAGRLRRHAPTRGRRRWRRSPRRCRRHRRRSRRGRRRGWAAGDGRARLARASRPGPRTRDEVATMLVDQLPRCPSAAARLAARSRPRGARRRRAGRPRRTPCCSTATARSSSTCPTTATRAGASRCPGRARRSTACAPRGVRVGVVSNQSGVARGLLTREEVDAVNARIEELLGPFDTWLVCPHGPTTAARAASRRPGWCCGPPRAGRRAASAASWSATSAPTSRPRGGRVRAACSCRPVDPRRGGRARAPEVGAADLSAAPVERAARTARGDDARPRRPARQRRRRAARRPGGPRGGRRRRPRHAAVRAARARPRPSCCPASTRCCVRRARGSTPSRSRSIARRIDALRRRGSRRGTSTRPSSSPRSTRARCRSRCCCALAGVAEIAAISVDYPGSLLDVRHPIAGDVHEVERGARRWSTRSGYRLPRRRRRAARRSRRAAAGAVALPTPYVVVHPGASVPARALGAGAHRGRSSPRCRRRAGGCVVTGGAARRALDRGVVGAATAASTSAARTTLAELAAVLARRRVRSSSATPARPTSPPPSARRSSRCSRPSCRRALAAVGRAARAARRPTSPCARLPGARCPVAGPSVPATGVGVPRRASPRSAPGPPAAAEAVGMRILLWHVHGSWTTAFVQGRHDLPAAGAARPRARRARAGRGPGTGRLGASRCTPAAAARRAIDVVVLQRPQELELLAERVARRPRPGRDVPAVYLEHNAPQGRIADMRHPAADRADLARATSPTSTRCSGTAARRPTRVIEHGDRRPRPPLHRRAARAPRSSSTRPAAAGRVTGTDLLAGFGAAAPIDLFGMDAAARPHVPAAHRGPAAGRACTTSWPAGACTCTRSAGRRWACRCRGHAPRACRSSRWRRPRRPRRCRRRPGWSRPRVDVLADAVRARSSPTRSARARAGKRGARRAALERYGLDAVPGRLGRPSGGGDGDEDRAWSPSTPARSPCWAASTPAARTSTSPRCAGAGAPRRTRSSSTPAATTRRCPSACRCGAGVVVDHVDAGPAAPIAQGRAAAVHGRRSPRELREAWRPTAARRRARALLDVGSRGARRRRAALRRAGRADLPRARRRQAPPPGRRRTRARRSGCDSSASSPRGVDRIVATCTDEVLRAACALGAAPRADHGRAVRRRPRALPPGRAGVAASAGAARGCSCVGRLVERKGIGNVDRGAGRACPTPSWSSPAARPAELRRRPGGAAAARPRRATLGVADRRRLLGARRARRRAGAAALGRRRRLRALVRAVRDRAARGDGLRRAGRRLGGRRADRHGRRRRHRRARAAARSRSGSPTRCARCSPIAERARRHGARRRAPRARAATAGTASPPRPLDVYARRWPRRRRARRGVPRGA